ncbi:MAG: acyltransferase [Acidobacteriota bacterium]|nr:acyltransferase [Acidobacteriota bacterium]
MSRIVERVLPSLRFERSPHAIVELDGLRALAILLVLGRHGSKVFLSPEQPFFQLGPWNGASLLINGWSGVDLFFVLSGFLIAYHLLRRWSADSWRPQARRYVQKRLLRIVPAYYAFLLLVVLGGVPGYAISREDLGWRTAYHLLFLQDYLPADIVVAFWSLGVEEKFYLVAPLLVVPLGLASAAAGRARWRWVAVLGVLFWIPAVLRFVLHPGGELGYEEYFFSLRSPFHASFDGLIAGCACAFLYARPETRRWLAQGRRAVRLQIGGAVAVLLLLVPAPLADTVARWEAALLGSALALAFAALMLGLLAGRTALNGWLSGQGLFVISKLSYSLYLVHMVFMDSLLAWLSSWPGYGGLSLELQFALYFPLFCAVSALAALLLHYLVERPFLALKDRI